MKPLRLGILLFLSLAWLSLAPQIVAAHRDISIGLESLPGPWNISGPAEMTVFSTDFSSRTLQLEAGSTALVYEGYLRYAFAQGVERERAAFLISLLQSSGVPIAIEKVAEDQYDVVYAGDPLKASKLIEAGWPLFLAPCPKLGQGPYAGLYVQLPGELLPALKISVQAHTGLVSIGDRQYRGVLEFAPRPAAPIVPVNRLPLEDYLLGVVPHEMPASWPLEALKAQAVAARTYAVKHLGKHKLQGYDLCDTTRCQAYGGATAEQARSSQAVHATTGQLITRRGSPIDAVYHAHAGGHTVSSRYAWGHEVPYLIAQAIPEEPPYVWSVFIPTAEFERLLGAYPLFQVNPTSFGEGGRVVEVDIAALIGRRTIPVHALRAAVGVNRVRSSQLTITPLNYWAGTIEPLPTLLQTVKQVEISEMLTLPAGCLSFLLPERPDAFLVQGSGFGHGVGMSQWGAYGMASLGFSYRDILARFYPGTTIEVGGQP